MCLACNKMGWKSPTPIQIESIPYAINGKDIIGLAETGSGKTGAFCLPILHDLLNSPTSYHSLIIAPTRELALQIQECVENLGTQIGIKTCIIIGGVGM